MKRLKDFRCIGGRHEIPRNLDENRIALEAHVVVTSDDFKKVELIKYRIKELLKNKFNIRNFIIKINRPGYKNIDFVYKRLPDEESQN